MSIEDRIDEIDFIGVEIAPIYEHKNAPKTGSAPYKVDLSTIPTHYDGWSENSYDQKAIDF